MNLECEHGQLARSCNICEYEREIAELRARVGELKAALRRETNEYIEASHTLVIERDEARGQIRELEAENKRLRELVDGATEVVEISNFTFPAQREWKAAWLKKAAKAMKEASDEST